MGEDVRVAIIIVNYRATDMVLNCLRSVAGEIEAAPGSYAVIMDSAPINNSTRRINDEVHRNGWEKWATVIEQKENRGYSYSNNRAIEYAKHINPSVRYFWLVNPDTVIEAGAMQALVDHLESTENAGIAGSGLNDLHGVSQRSAHRFHSPMGELFEVGFAPPVFKRFFYRYLTSPMFHNSTYQCDWVSGASLMINRTAYDDLGGLDEGYFLYFEDVDLCWRAKKKKWSVWYVHKAKVLHIEGTLPFFAKRYRWPQHWYKSRRKFFLRAYGFGGMIAADIFRIIGFVLVFIQYSFRLGLKVLLAILNLIRYDMAPF